MLVTIVNSKNVPIKKRRNKFPLTLGALSRILATQISGPVFLDQFATVNRSVLGRYVGVGCFSYLRHATVGNYVHIGSRVSVGGFNHPTDWMSIGSFQYQRTKRIWDEEVRPINLSPTKENVTISSDVWIGDNAVILSGVALGTGTVVAGGAVVTKTTEPYSIVAGNPARLIRRRFSDRVIQGLLRSKWWELRLSQLDGLRYDDVHSVLQALRRYHAR